MQVKLVKCIVQNIVVDISFNQLGGLCTLCFLEKVSSEDHQPLLKYWVITFAQLMRRHDDACLLFSLCITLFEAPRILT